MLRIRMMIKQGTFASNCLSMQLSPVGMPFLLLQMVNAMALVLPSAPQ